MSYLFINKNTIKVFLPDSHIVSLKLASDSLINDLSAIFGHAEYCKNKFQADIAILIDESLIHDEEYSYTVKDDGVTISGKDDLGTIFGIYSFLENELKVPPFYKIEGLKLQKKESLLLNNKTESSFPSTKFRGWFINDEDLLTNYKYEGHRELDYPFYKNVIREDMIDLLAETVLRYRMNLIIPSTLVDINNPPERKLIEVCAKRGLYISQHHIEPMGLSKFGFEKYVKEHNLSEGFSYISNKQTLLKVWEYYAKKWSDFPRVVWQLGLRGGTDQPVWKSEASLDNTNEARGALISSAIKDQYDIINKVYKHPIYTSSTLWMEGAELLKTGDIKLPKNTIVVFADIGISQLFGDDFFSVKREKERKYGIYYHAAYWHMGPHLAEGILPKKMEYCYNLAKDNSSDYYSVMNVANVKELTFSIYMNSLMTWNSQIDIKKIIDKYCSLFECSDLLSSLIYKYYSSFGEIGDIEFEKFCKKYSFDYHKYNNLSFPIVALNDGIIKSMIWNIPIQDKMSYFTPLFEESLENGYKNMEETYQGFLSYTKSLPIEYQNGFSQHWVHESFYMKNMLEEGYHYLLAYKHYHNGDIKQYEKHMNLAIEFFDRILDNRYVFYKNEWANWFDGEAKIGIKTIRNTLINELSKYSGGIK